VQFNVEIDAKIKSKIQEMVKRFRSNQWALTEHLLQVALYYTNIAMNNEEKRKIIEEHLLNAHLLGKYDDEELIIRSVEPNQNWMLLAHSKQVVARAVRLNNFLAQVSKTGDINLLEREEKELHRAILWFADYLVKHRFEDVEDEL
jgi:hypothetical protein